MSVLDHPQQIGERPEVVEASPPPTTPPSINRCAPAAESRGEPRQPESFDRAVLTGFVKGTIVGTVVVFLICGGITVVAGFGWGPAIGVGAFAAFWGGPGFGGMLGAVLGHAHAVD